MKRIKFILMTIVETLLRMLPFPSKTGLFPMGHPDRHSPVLVTCNFHLTVERVKRALKGLDCYLLVANSHGINVWCAAAGGHFTQHSVISVLKTSGIENLVDHRNVILPQLAAPGVEAREIHRHSGWRVLWGPVHAKDIPAFLKNNFKKTPGMSEVKFPLAQRMELAIAWAFPISALGAVIVSFFWQAAVPPLICLIWGLSFFIFLLFPFYSRWLASDGKRTGFIFFDFGKGGFQIIVWGIFMAGLAIFTISTDRFRWGMLVRWGIVSFIVILILSMDLKGSTPIYKSGLHEDVLLKIYLDKTKCRGAGFCKQVCPRSCFKVDRENHTASMPRRERCVQCGACIVQCPFDALYFRRSTDEIIPPETIRKFKLNLMGKRLAKIKQGDVHLPQDH